MATEALQEHVGTAPIAGLVFQSSESAGQSCRAMGSERTDQLKKTGSLACKADEALTQLVKRSISLIMGARSPLPPRLKVPILRRRRTARAGALKSVGRAAQQRLSSPSGACPTRRRIAGRGYRFDAVACAFEGRCSGPSAACDRAFDLVA
jgi:hypothetical protein